MSTDWEALRIAGGGFGITILILIFLALAAWLVGRVLQRTNKGEKGGENKKGEV